MSIPKLCTDSVQLTGATGLSRLSRTEIGFPNSAEILVPFKVAAV